MAGLVLIALALHIQQRPQPQRRPGCRPTFTYEKQ